MAAREVYLDNSATTRVLPRVAAVMAEVLTENYGNPSSLHGKGLEAEKILRDARRLLSDACGVKEQGVIFTSGGTEANNLAVKGAARRRRQRGRHLITTKIEHPSVLYTVRALEKEGFDVTWLDVDSCGRVSSQAVGAALRDDTILVSIMHVNNEVGTIQPVEEIGSVIKKSGSHILFHVDAVQSFCKMPVLPELWQADLVSLSAHKIHGPKGVGALICRGDAVLEPLLHGGDQERAVRPGTENTSGVAGFAEAARLYLASQEENMRAAAALRERLLCGMRSRLPDAVHNGPPDGAPHIVNFTIPRVRGEVLVHTLEKHGIYVSTGSACHSHRADPSHVLLAMGRQAKQIESSLRFSFSPINTAVDIDFTLDVLQEAVAELRLLSARKK